MGTNGDLVDYPSCTALPGAGTDYPDLHVVFDFFADNPQKMLPQGEQTNNTRQDNPFYDRYWESIRLMQESDLFVEGMLLRSVDYKPRFPYIHYIMYKTPDKGKHGNELPPNGRVNNNTDITRQYMNISQSPGGYSEMQTFVDRRTPLLPKRPSNPNTAYIVSSFKTAGNLDSLDRTWTYWSGADYIVENIPPKLKLERMTFHKLRCGAEKDNFSYVLMCEISEAMADLEHAMEFTDTLKYRQCGVTSLYTIDHFF